MVRILFYFAVIASLISQLPMVLESGLDAYLKLSWVPLTIFLIFLHPNDVVNKKLQFYYGFLFCFGWYLFLLEIFTGRHYITNGGDLYNMWISLLIFIDCFIFWKYYSSIRTYKNIVLIINFGCLLLGIIVYFFFLRYADITSTTYAYEAKNSLGQILFVGGVMSLVALNFFPEKRKKIFIIMSVLILLVIIMLLKSRATIVCIGLVVGYYMLQKESIKLRRYIFIGAVVCILILLFSEQLYNLIVVNIIFANRDTSSVSSLSSGRSDHILQAIKLIDENWLIGVGHKYVDCMPISIFLQFGIFGLLMVMTFILYLSYKVVKLSKSNIINLTVFLIYWSFILNSLFEAYPPFGPGVKCFPLWMLLGFSFSDKSNFLNKRVPKQTYKNSGLPLYR